MDDAAQLLKTYVNEREPAAFAAWTHRHIDLVYSSARRHTGGDAHQAQEITQMVFLTAFRKASALSRHPAPLAWLHQATRLAACELRRAEARRRTRETTAATDPSLADNASACEPPIDWSQVEPLLDEALATLGEQDREAVLLRHFAHKTYAEIGAALGLVENAARMRTDRALEKLRRALAKRGVTSTASALGLALGANAVTAAPASVMSGVLGATSAAAAVVTGASATTGFFTLMTTSTKLTFGVTAALVAAAGLGWGVFRSNSPTTTARVSPAVSQTTPGLAFPASPADPNSIQLSASLAKKLSATEKALKTKRIESALNESWNQAYIREAASRAQMADPKQSVFSSLEEAGLFVVHIKSLNKLLAEKYPADLDPDSPLFADFLRDKDAFNLELVTLVQDPLFVGEMRSGDPTRMSAAQIAYIAPLLDLDSQQTQAVRDILKDAQREANARKFGSADRPGDDAKPWQAGRDKLGAQAADKIKSLLTPEQRDRYDEIGFEDPAFKFSFSPRASIR